MSDTLCSLGQCESEEIKPVSEPLVIQCLALLPHAGMYIQCSICVFALRWVSLCVILCAIHLALSHPTAWQSYSVCVCVCMAAKQAFCFLALGDPL